MKSVRRQRRLSLSLALGVSACLHLMLAAWMRHSAPPVRVPLSERALQVRLDAPEPAPAPASAPAAQAAAPLPAAAPPDTANAPLAGAAGAPSPTKAPVPISAPIPVAAATLDSGIGVALGAGEQLDGLAEVQLRYPSTMPAPATIAYTVSGAQQGAASLQWSIQNQERYRLTLVGPDGRSISSHGIIGDAGLMPEEAGHDPDQESAGGARRIRFDRSARQLSADAGGRSYPIIDSALDPWSVLLQLSAVGLARPERLREPIVFFVGGLEGTATVRFEPLGRVTIETALGAIETEHLRQVAQAGQGWVEVWLAPAHDYLPVQLRRVAPGGASITHTMRSFSAAAP